MTDPGCGSRRGDQSRSTRSLALALADLLPDGDQRCTERLTYDLAADAIIQQAHIIADQGSTPRLCVHYNPAQVAQSDVEHRTHRAAADIAGRYGHLRWSVTDDETERLGPVARP